MKKNIFKSFITSLILTIVLFTFISSSAYAATGFQGYAVYRDGVMWNIQWHAGLMDEPYTIYYNPITHHPGSGTVTWDSFSVFLNGNNFKGVYKPKSDPSSSQRDIFVTMGRNLITENIEYNLMYQVAYHLNQDLGAWVSPDEIIGMRCDGVVEYVYEWSSVRVYGSDKYWDVTKFGFWEQDHHSGFNITPRKQASDYLTLVQTSEPKP